MFNRPLFPVALLLAAANFALPTTAVAADHPNIVLIISDDQAWGDYSFMGHPHIQTPHIDRLANESLTFTRAYVPDSLCRPSLATIVTGLYPHQHGIVGNDPLPSAALASLPKGAQRRDPRYVQQCIDLLKHIDDSPKIAQILHDRLGYLSHQSGKWWEGNFSRGGFTHGMTHGDRQRGGRHGDEGLVIGRSGLEPIREFIDSTTRQEKPFFVYYAPFLPHAPHNPPQRLLDKYLHQTPHLPWAKYWAMCEWFDETLGELLNHLDEKGLSENTLVLYVTDNGWINQTESSTYAPRSKRSPYEGGVRTPIMIRWPKRVKPRIDRQHLANSIDLVPTILAAVGLEPSEQMQGINLLDEEAVAGRTAIFGEIFDHDIQHMTDPVKSLRFRWVIDGRWKLIVPHAAREPDAQIELFDLLTDPHEKDDLAAKYPQRVEQLTARLNAWWNIGAENVDGESVGAEEQGFESIFNGKDLTGWEGDAKLWTVQDGAITGTTTDESPLDYNKFLIWRDGTLKNFELRAQVRLIGSSNSGIQYRSRQLQDAGEFVVAGYQADVHPTPENNGMLYDERGRGILATNGQKVIIDAEGDKWIVASTAEVKAHPLDQWNDYTVIARGNHLVHKINGHTTIDLVDHQATQRELEGILALQVHRGPAMKAQFKNIRLKVLPDGGVVSLDEAPIPDDAQKVPPRKPRPRPNKPRTDDGK